MDSVERANWVDSRWGRALLFVAVVWGVAGSFIAIQIVLEQSLDRVLAHPTAATDFALSTATRTSLTCESGRSGARSLTPEVRSTAWMLGLKTGRDAIARQYSSVNASTLAASRKEVEMFSSAAGVPVPSIFVAAHAVNANTDFIAYVESEAMQTARALAAAYAPEACRLFKLGALWGYASMVRPALPGERNIFSAEIRHHADGTIPTELWKAMIEPTSSSASADSIFRADAATTEKVTRYLRVPH